MGEPDELDASVALDAPDVPDDPIEPDEVEVSDELDAPNFLLFAFGANPAYANTLTALFRDPSQLLRNIVLYLVPMILSLSVHEFSHAYVATKLGDDTPEREERLTLSPLAHIDVLGTLVIPIFSILTMGQALIGWARPVNINPARFHRGVNMRRGMTLASAAGPISNLLLAILAIGLFTGLSRFGVLNSTTGAAQQAISRLLIATFTINVSLCVFNLLPIPPLDGSRLLPSRMDDLVGRMAPYSFLLITLVLMIPALRIALLEWPINLLTTAILSVFGHGLEHPSLSWNGPVLTLSVLQAACAPPPPSRTRHHGNDGCSS